MTTFDDDEATKKCPYCAETIKAEAIICRFCGRDLRIAPTTPNSMYNLDATVSVKPKRRVGGCQRAFWIALIIIIGLGVIYQIGSQPSGTTAQRSVTGASSSSRPIATATLTSAQLEERAKEVPFSDLARTIESYIGDILHFKGEVIQVQEMGTDRAVMRVNMTEGEYFWEDPVWVNYQGPRMLEGDILDIYAVVDGRRSYEAVLGNSITIPELTSLKVKLDQKK